MLAKRRKRLQKEILELRSNPIENCSAAPLESDIGTWHANIWVPELKTAFHFEIKYPYNYPQSPPKVRNCTCIDHPNVFGQHICLDMLTERTASTPFRGWTPAYTISSLLVQLESFLFEAVKNRKPESKNKSRSTKPEKVKRVITGNDVIWYRPTARSKTPHEIKGPKVTLEDLQGKFINTWKDEVLVRGKRVTFRAKGRGSNAPVYDTIIDTGDTFVVNQWVLPKDSDSIFWSKKHSIGRRSGFSITPQKPIVGMVPDAKDFHCTKCGHKNSNIIPEIQKFSCVTISTNKSIPEPEPESIIDEDAYFFLDDCDNIILEILFQFCDEATVTMIGHAMGTLSVLDLALAKERYKCFYTLQKIEEPKVVLGMGARTAIMPRRSRKTGKKTSQLQQLHCSFDFLSYDAFKQGVRNNIWKDQKFDHFIPLYINSKHGKSSLPVAEKCIVDIWCSRELTHKLPNLTPAIILETLTKLMNTTVVNMMKTVEDLEVGELQMFDSIKALEGFCSMHHLLLAFTSKYPEIATVATQKVKRFIENPLMRDKEVTPDIGELMIDVALSNYTWDDFSTAWLEETFVRNARWIVAKYPNLLKIEKCSSCVRLTQSFNATRTGKRLAMFQRFFISEIASPARLRGNPNKNNILLREYNSRMGLPESGMADRLQQHSRNVIGCTNWWDYFALVDFCAPSHAHLSAWLRNSITVSDTKQYHHEWKILRYSEHHITKPNQTDQLNGLNCVCSGSMYKLPENYQVVRGGSCPELINKKRSGVDICFVMDCTGSMSSWISTAKERIKDIIADVSEKYNGGTVRFAIVGYRDHDSPGSGEDKWVLKTFDFTASPVEATQRVSLFYTGGGGGPEAMCCGMGAAASMSWNRDSHQIVVLIGDQPPHGLGGPGDSAFPDGCPCGSDTLRIVHTMEKNGIVVYPVDCGDQEDANRQVFYHALARITGGYAINLKEAHLLPNIVFGACMEEHLMDKLVKHAAPIYKQCLKSHRIGRFEQHCRTVFTELKSKDIGVESCFPGDDYGDIIEEQVDAIAQCMDIKNAKYCLEHDNFVPINRQTKLCSYMERPVTLCQVTKCLKRMKRIIAESKVLSEGCQYKCSERFSKEAFAIRWPSFKTERCIKSFSPWNRLTPEKIKNYENIPDGERLRHIKSKIAKVCLPSVIPRDMVGKEIQIEQDGKWKIVFVQSFIRGEKIRVLMKDGFESVIPESTKWKPHSNNAWTSSNRGSSRGSAWGSCEKLETRVPAPTRKPVNRIRTAPAPLKNAWTSSNRGSSRGSAESSCKKLETIVPAPTRKPYVNQERTRPAPVGQRKASGKAQHLNKHLHIPAVPSWLQKEEFPQQQYPNVNNSSKSGSGCSADSIHITTSLHTKSVSKERFSPPHKFVLGQIVDCRLSPQGSIHVGTVINLCPLILRVPGFVDGRWRFVRERELTEIILPNVTNVYSTPDSLGNMIEKISLGMRVRVLEYVGDFAHIVHPTEGWINLKEPAPVLCEPIINTPVLATLEVNVLDGMKAKDLAMCCQTVGAVPKKVSIKLIEGRLVGLVRFHDHQSAEVVFNRGISHFGWKLQLRWSQEYLEFRAKEITI